jgi:DNA-binding NtrC family response regulator
MSTQLRVLLVEDSESDTALIVRYLTLADYDVGWRRVETAGQMRAALEQPDWDLVIADYKLPGSTLPPLWPACNRPAWICRSWSCPATSAKKPPWV